MLSQLSMSTIGGSSAPIRVLRSIQRHGFKHSIIAGGAIRDLYTNKTIKDFDIFIWDQRLDDEPINEIMITEMMNISDAEFDDPDSFVFIESASSTADDDIKEGINSTYASDSHIQEIWNVSIGEYVYQLMFIKMDPIEYVNTHFDFGICRAFCDGVKLHFSSSFLNDVRNKTITIHDVGYSQYQFDYMLRHHLQRIRRKFPGYTVMVDSKCVNLINTKNSRYLTKKIKSK